MTRLTWSDDLVKESGLFALDLTCKVIRWVKEYLFLASLSLCLLLSTPGAALPA